MKNRPQCSHSSVVDPTLFNKDLVPAMHFSSKTDPAFANIDYWQEDVGNNLFGLDFQFERDKHFYVEFDSWGLGDMLFSNLHFKNQLVTPSRKIDNNDYVFLKFVRSGTMVIEQKGRAITAKQGSIVLINPQYNFCENFPGFCNLTFLSIPKQALENVGITASIEQPVVYPDKSPECSMLWDLMLLANRNSEFMGAAQQRLLGQQILDWLKISNALLRTDSCTRTTQLTLLRIKAYIRDNIHNPQLDINQIANDNALSSGYINRLFNTEKTSIMRYVRDERLNKAKQLLQNYSSEAYSIDEISWRCGFSYLSHFSRTFKKVYLLSPREYRHHCKINALEKNRPLETSGYR